MSNIQDKSHDDPSEFGYSLDGESSDAMTTKDSAEGLLQDAMDQMRHDQDCTFRRTGLLICSCYHQSLIDRIQAFLSQSGEGDAKDFAEAVWGCWISDPDEHGRHGCDHCNMRFDRLGAWTTAKHDDGCIVQRAKEYLDKTPLPSEK